MNLQVALYCDGEVYDYYVFASPETDPDEAEFKKFITTDERALVDVSEYVIIDQIDLIRYVDGTYGKRYRITLEEV
jgi:hypothetical protein